MQSSDEEGVSLARAIASEVAEPESDDGLGVARSVYVPPELSREEKVWRHCSRMRFCKKKKAPKLARHVLQRIQKANKKCLRKDGAIQPEQSTPCRLKRDYKKPTPVFLQRLCFLDRSRPKLSISKAAARMRRVRGGLKQRRNEHGGALPIGRGRSATADALVAGRGYTTRSKYAVSQSIQDEQAKQLSALPDRIVYIGELQHDETEKRVSRCFNLPF